MKKLKITFASGRNISVNDVNYFDIDPGDLDDQGNVPEWLLQDTWQEAVNEYMADTYIEVIEEEDG